MQLAKGVAIQFARWDDDVGLWCRSGVRKESNAGRSRSGKIGSVVTRVRSVRPGLVVV